MSWIASMELDSSGANISRVVQEVLDEYPGPEHARLREAFREWILGAAESWGIEEEVLERVRSLKEAGMVYAGVEELNSSCWRRSPTRSGLPESVTGSSNVRRVKSCWRALARPDLS